MKKLRLNLFGTFRVMRANGQAVPLGLKARGLMALLALSPEMSRSRAYLQDRLWSEADSARGRMNLRRVLADIRRSLGPEQDCLLTDRQTIALDMPSIALDTDDIANLSFGAVGEGDDVLETLGGLEAIADPEFEDWLRDARARLEAVLRDAVPLERQSPKPTPPPEGGVPTGARAERPWVMVRPSPQSLSVGTSPGLAFLGNMLMHAIVRGISETATVDVVDRGRDSPGMVVEFDLHAVGRTVQALVSLMSAPDGAPVWSFAHELRSARPAPSSLDFLILVNHTVQTVLKEAARRVPTSARDTAMVLASDAVDAIAHVEPQALARAEQLLSDALTAEPRPVHLALKAFLRTFYYGEQIPCDPDVIREEARELLHRAIMAEPHNSTILALGAHVRSFLLGEIVPGRELAEESLRYNSANPLAMTFLARARLHAGDGRDAYRLITRARQVCGPNPFRFMVDFNSCLIAALVGKNEEAIEFAQIAHAAEPNFLPPMRYLFALQLRESNRDAARQMFDRIRSREPEFGLRQMHDPSYPVAALRNASLLPRRDADFD